MFKEGIIVSKSKTFLAFCFCFLAGVATISILNIQFDLIYLYSSLFGFVTLLIFFWKKKLVRFTLFCVLFFVLGIGRYLIAFPPNTSDHISYYNGEEKMIIGYVVVEPDIRMDSVRYIVRVISSYEGTGRDLSVREQKDSIKGKIYLKSGLYPRYKYGDVLEIDCSLEKPEVIEDVNKTSRRDFRYDMYLARFGVFSICSSPKIQYVDVGDPSLRRNIGAGQDDGKVQAGNVVMHGILNIKNAFAEKINILWHEPYASFMAGLLYGYRGGLGSLNDLFSTTGVTHIVAISGYNITIIATILITLCIHLLIPRKKAFWLVTLGIILFVLFAGASASVVRAGVMGIIVLFAKQIGRMSRIGNVLILTAVLMTIQNPFVLIWDAGFQLSFLSTLGLVYLSPVLKPWFHKIPETFGLQESLVSTLSAIIATLPLILYQFGRLSIVAPIVNILILWSIPLIMFAGFAAVFASFLFLPIGKIISWIAWVGLEYIIRVVKFFAGLPFASVNIAIPFWLMISLYVLLFYFLRIKKAAASGLSVK